MKRSLLLLFISTTILAACGGDDGKGKNDAELVKLKKERASIDEKIAKLEAEVNKNKPGKATAVSVMVATPQPVSYTHLDVYKRQGWRYRCWYCTQI